MLELKKKFVYCDNCPFFEVEIITVKMADNRTNTTLKCASESKCEIIAKGLVETNRWRNME